MTRTQNKYSRSKHNFVWYFEFISTSRYLKTIRIFGTPLRLLGEMYKGKRANWNAIYHRRGRPWMTKEGDCSRACVLFCLGPCSPVPDRYREKRPPNWNIRVPRTTYLFVFHWLLSPADLFLLLLSLLLC